MHRPRLDLPPTRQRIAPQGIWLLWAIFASSLLVISALGLAGQIAVLPERTVTGRFEAQTPTVDLVVPSGLKVSEILVEDGDTVEKGQRVILFDQVALHRHLQHIRSEISARESALECWSTTDAYVWENGATAPPVPPQVQTCQLAKQQERLAQEQLMMRRTSLKRETALAVHELVSRAENTPHAVRRILLLRAALERETLNSVVREVEFELAQLLTLQKEGHVQHKTRLKDEIAALENQKTALEDRTVRPWLEAPVKGQLARLRQAPQNMARGMPVTIAQIQTDQQKAFQAEFLVSSLDAVHLQRGQTLQVVLTGLPYPNNRIDAHIQAIQSAGDTSAPQTKVTVRLTPPPKVMAALQSMPNGTRSTIHVTMSPQKLTDLLHGASRHLMQSF